MKKIFITGVAGFIGFSLSLKLLKKNQVKVTYTPEPPAQTVAEYVIGLMIYLLRNIEFSRKNFMMKKWNKIIGKDLKEAKIGIIGFGTQNLLKP